MAKKYSGRWTDGQTGLMNATELIFFQKYALISGRVIVLHMIQNVYLHIDIV
jgi:hypothetical protein